MEFNVELLKKHPYATGGVVIVGGIILFYLMSRRGSSGATSSSGDSGYYAADASLGQAQAAAAIQTNAQNAAIATAQINASVTNAQTTAAENTTNAETVAALLATLDTNKSQVEVTQSNNDAQTLQQVNMLQSQQNVYSIQEQGLIAQINEAETENANNNATSLDALKSQLDYQSGVNEIAAGLQLNQQENYNQNVRSVLPLIGKKYNTKEDANRATTEIQTILSGGNPYVAASGNQFLSNQAATSAYSQASIINSITNLGQRIAAGFFA